MADLGAAFMDDWVFLADRMVGDEKEGETHVMTVVPTWLNFPLVQ